MRSSETERAEDLGRCGCSLLFKKENTLGGHKRFTVAPSDLELILYSFQLSCFTNYAITAAFAFTPPFPRDTNN